MTMSEERTTIPIGNWTVYIDLGEVDGVAADEWMDAITEAIFARDPGFSGVIGMQKDMDHD